MKLDPFMISLDNGKRVRVRWTVRGKQKHLTAIWYFRNQPHWLACETSVPVEAKRIASAEVLKIAREADVAPHEPLLLENAIQICLDSRYPPSDPVLRGIRSYKVALYALRNFQKYLGSADLRSFSADQMETRIQLFIDKKKSSWKPRTIQNVVGRIRRFFAWLMKRKFLPWSINPASIERLELPPLEDPHPNPLTDEQLDALLPAAKHFPVYPLVLLCYGGGCRPAEALRVKWSEINFVQSTVVVTNKKGNSIRTRTAQLSQWACDELKKWKREHPGDKVWSLGDGYHFRNFRRVCLHGTNRLPSTVTLQTLRQTACTRAILAGLALPDYVAQFGHSLSMAQRHYLRITPSAARRSIINILAPKSEAKTVANLDKKAIQNLMYQWVIDL